MTNVYYRNQMQAFVFDRKEHNPRDIKLVIAAACPPRWTDQFILGAEVSFVSLLCLFTF